MLMSKQCDYAKHLYTKNQDEEKSELIVSFYFITIKPKFGPISLASSLSHNPAMSLITSPNLPHRTPAFIRCLVENLLGI